MLEAVGHPYLRNVLDSGQSCSHDAEEIGPDVELVRQGNGKYARQCNHNQSVKDGEAANSESRLPSWTLPAKLFLRHVGFAIAEEDEEQNEAVVGEDKN